MRGGDLRRGERGKGLVGQREGLRDYVMRLCQAGGALIFKAAVALASVEIYFLLKIRPPVGGW